jgi:hypothetical protein
MFGSSPNVALSKGLVSNVDMLKVARAGAGQLSEYNAHLYCVYGDYDV